MGGSLPTSRLDSLRLRVGGKTVRQGERDSAILKEVVVPDGDGEAAPRLVDDLSIEGVSLRADSQEVDRREVGRDQFRRSIVDAQRQANQGRNVVGVCVRSPAAPYHADRESIYAPR